jgi:hypothetical protein
VLHGDKINVVPPEGHDTFDKVWGWSQRGGALVGLIALGIAIVSWWYAKRAGAAAEA